MQHTPLKLQPDVLAIVDEHSASFEEYVALVRLHEEMRWRESEAPHTIVPVTFTDDEPDTVRRQTAQTIPAGTERVIDRSTTLPCNRAA